MDLIDCQDGPCPKNGTQLNGLTLQGFTLDGIRMQKPEEDDLVESTEFVLTTSDGRTLRSTDLIGATLKIRAQERTVDSRSKASK
jgi:hypothetical protein